MKRSYTELAYHVVFATKHRQRIIPARLDKEVRDIIYQACLAVDAHVYEIGPADVEFENTLISQKYKRTP